MANNLITCFIAFASLIAPVGLVVAASPVIDLDEGTVSGARLQPSIDAITDILGRPTLVAGSAQTKQLVYADKGLEVEFRDGQMVKLTVHLIEKPDILKRYVLRPFSGELSHGITADTKAKEIMRRYRVSAEAATDSANIVEQARKEAAEIMQTGKRKPSIKMAGPIGIITVPFRRERSFPVVGEPALTHDVLFTFETTTGFVKEIDILWHL